MTKIEEVARALYEATPFKTAGSYDSQSEVYKRMCRVLARAAIEAMREPSIAMRHVATFQAAEIDWPAMIDAALSEDKEQG